ncbi:hypothetical protein Q8791_27265 [Nocardiopsis sp. CT-R113]|uniref:Uncharacterized protein n=1 Tax=Nocardiopsis codii TaxID=3065942 RepID=A0ABU7KFA5_9ACTN|nr:hypothetical protein [Nocardiopsis sp. CT-R113]MEE2040926.1 hypothetical protein [Nocardiopsis sp. CT-R113]
MAPIELEVYTDDPASVAALRAYWDFDEDTQTWAQTVTEVRKQHALSQPQMTRILRTCGTVRMLKSLCPTCGECATASNRSEYAHRMTMANALCEACQAASRAAQAQAAKERSAVRRAKLAETFPVFTLERAPVQKLSLFQAVALQALFSDPALEDAGLTTPTTGWPKERPWAPANLYVDYERRVLHAKPPTLFAHPDSHVDAFDWEEKDEPSGSFYLGKVSYYLLGSHHHLPDRVPGLLNDLNHVFREGPWPTAWLEQWKALWDELVLSYASAYLDMKLREHHLEMKQGDGTRTALADALATFSLGQVFNLIYRATKDAAAYYQRGGVNKRQAANSTVGRISSGADRARANGWEIKSFNLPWNLPLSAMGEIFFHKVMWQADMMHLPVGEVRPPEHASEDEPQG